MKASCYEPAKRELTLVVSEAELVVLVKWHCSQAKSVVKRFGQAALELRASTPFPVTGRMQELAKVAKEQQAAHIQRANGLAGLVQNRRKS